MGSRTGSGSFAISSRTVTQGSLSRPRHSASILANERRTQREVAEVAGVTEVTIRNRYKELTEKLGIKVEL